MDVFGLTPIDAAYTVFGLQCCQQIIDLLFQQTKLGYVVLLIGFLLVLLKGVYISRWKSVLIYLLLCLFICFCSYRTIKPHQILSYQEKVDHSLPLKTQFILISSNQMPMPLFGVYINSILMSVVNAVIAKCDALYPTILSFSKNIFGVQQLSLENHKMLISGKSITPKLTRDIDDFIQDQFWPALNRVKKNVWPDDAEIERLYSLKGGQEWISIKNEISELVSQSDWWSKSLNLLSEWHPNPQVSYRDQISHAIVTHSVLHNKSILEDFSINILKLWPHFVGGVSAFVWVLCIPVILGALLTLNRGMFVIWIKGLFWSKCLWLIGFLSYICSLMFAQVEYSQSMQSGWFLDQPVFGVLAVFLLIALTPLSVLMIWRL